MDKKEEMRICGECHKEVAEGNFALHEMHCRRFLCVCPDCDETVPRELLDQHREEQHTQVKCSKCNKKVERRHLLDHQADECLERLQICQFCKMELLWKELDEHHLVCGSRTERCGDCGLYVTLRDQSEHDLTCSAIDNVSVPPQTLNKLPPNSKKIRVNCDRCKASLPAEDIEKHKLLCVTSTGFDEVTAVSGREAFPLSKAYKATSLSERVRRGPCGDGHDPDEISTCPHCHLALPILTLLWHEAKCQIHVLKK